MIERDEYKPPADAIEALARRLYPEILAYFESEEGQRAFAEWRTQQDAEKSAVKSGSKPDHAA